MSIIDNVKEIADLIKKVGDIELYRKIVELEGEVVELTREKRLLEEKDAELEKQLSISKEIFFKGQFYFMPDDEVPFCPKCWEYDKKAIHLVKPYPGTPHRPQHQCPNCKTLYWQR